MVTDLLAIQVKALEATKACTCLIKSTHLKAEYSLAHRSCPDCEGTGRVPILGDELQMKCQDEFCLDGMDRGAPSLYKCRSCQGRGWTPSGDMAAWMRALRAAKIGFVIGIPAKTVTNSAFFAAASVNNIEGDCIENEDPELVFYTTIAQGVEVLAMESL